MPDERGESEHERDESGSGDAPVGSVDGPVDPGDAEIGPESAGSDGRRTSVESTVDDRFRVPLRGLGVDAETRCRHWDDEVDVVAIRFACCETYYPCFECHDATVDHSARRWPRERFDEATVLCGVCSTTLTAREYLDCDDACPSCGATFNPGCRRHRDRYFEP